MKKFFISFLIISQLIAPIAKADDLIKNTQNDILTVAAAGVGGAILGLSTLSFVDEPSKHLPNIWTGAAIGVIAGVVFVAVNSAQKNSEDLQSSRDFSTYERVAWHRSQENLVTPVKTTFFSTLWSTSF
ncbi:MAG TPA: hypothetical protein VKY27_03690 [Bacteriovoracaceae bacterium]|nr:hypothetical protein [Bacteriovoracaceae bacterium]